MITNFVFMRKWPNPAAVATNWARTKWGQDPKWSLVQNRSIFPTIQIKTLITPLPGHQSACSFFRQPAMTLNCQKNQPWSKYRGLGGPQVRRCEQNELKKLRYHTRNLNNSTPNAPIYMKFFSAGSYDPKLSEKSSLVKISRPGRPPGLAVRAKRVKKTALPH